ncbi:HAD family hydrolase [Sporichthya polymorpha]|uniref:HAD family hydrolase n=1 Tax=Sporichthya polymorpha TaxID=35751 RepID=UPI000363AD23|nr:HAD hydrolase family protein [Sporichthya polymorpha]
MSIRIVYSDLDGTMVGARGCFLRRADLEPTLEPAAALHDLLRADVTLVLVSGRTRLQLSEAARIFGADGFVGELGAVIGWRYGIEHEVLRGAMPPEFDGNLYDVVMEIGLVEEIAAAFPGQLELYDPWHLGHEADVMLRGRADVAEVEKWLAERDLPWLRLHDNGRLPAAAGLTPDGHQLHVYHLMADGITKGTGIAADLARRGLTPDQAIAIGDSRSDLEMAPFVRRFFLTANGAHVVEHGVPDNLTVCQGENGLGWVEAVRWALDS